MDAFEGLGRNKVAIVTGSATGIGRAIAIQLAKAGSAVVVNYTKSKDEAVATGHEIADLGVPVLLEQCDVSDDQAVRRMVTRAKDELGGVDYLVNNAGTTTYVEGDHLELWTEDIWDRVLAVNLKGTFFCCRAVAAPMKERGGGAIVNVAALAGIRDSTNIPYSASKAAVINLTHTLARALGPQIRVNAVAPGMVETRWTRDRYKERFEEAKARAASRTALGRIATPEDIAQVVLSLIFGSDMVTGQTLVIGTD